MTVLAGGDIAVAHNEEDELDDNEEGADLQSLVLLPPTIKTEVYQLNINAWRGEGLPKMDTCK